MKIFSIYDRATESYSPPFFQPTNNAAIRAFTDEVNRQGSQINAHPTDFELVSLGDFNEQTGQIAATAPTRLARAEDLKTEA